MHIIYYFFLQWLKYNKKIALRVILFFIIPTTPRNILKVVRSTHVLIICTKE